MMGLQGHYSRLKSSVFAKQIGVLISGNAISYVIAFASLPILTRIFPKESFDWLTLYLSAISIGGVVISLQYEQAIVVCKEKQDVAKLFFLSILSASAIIVVLGILATLAIQFNLLAKYLDKYPESFIYYVLIGTWIAAVYQSTMQALNKQQQYKLMSFNKILVAVLTVVTQLFFWKYPLFGILLALVLGHVLGKGLSLTITYKPFFNLIAEALNHSFSAYKKLIYKFRDFQQFNLVAVLIDRIAFELPVFLITLWFTDYLADYGMAYRVLMVPMALFCTSYSQVFMRKASDLWNQHVDIRPLINQTWLLIGALLLIPFIILIIFGGELFSLIFGKEWYFAGQIASILVPFQWFSAMSSTTSVAFSVIRKQHFMVFFSVLSVIYRLISFAIGYHLGNFNIALICFSISHITALTFYNWVLLRYSNPNRIKGEAQ